MAFSRDPPDRQEPPPGGGRALPDQTVEINRNRNQVPPTGMNSQGNQPPQIPADSESLNRRFDEQRLTPNIDATINPTDVLCGRGKSNFTHVGNRRFRDAITNAIDEYNGSESRLAKSRVVQRIVENIKREGGRFLKRDRVNGGWVELDTKSCRDKVGHAIRDAANLIEVPVPNRNRNEVPPNGITGFSPAGVSPQPAVGRPPSPPSSWRSFWGLAERNIFDRVKAPSSPRSGAIGSPLTQHMSQINPVEQYQIGTPHYHQPGFIALPNNCPQVYTVNSNGSTSYSVDQECMQEKGAQAISNSDPVGSLEGANRASPENQILGQAANSPENQRERAVSVLGRSLLHNRPTHSSPEETEDTVKACGNNEQFDDAEEEFYHPEPKPIVSSSSSMSGKSKRSYESMMGDDEQFDDAEEEFYHPEREPIVGSSSSMCGKCKRNYKFMMEAFQEEQTILPENSGPARAKEKLTNVEEAKGVPSAKNNFEFVLGRSGGEWTTDQIGSAYRRTWETRFLELKAYKERNGHANPQQSTKSGAEGYKLSKWLCRQRMAYKKGKLAPEKLQKLKELGCSGLDPASKKKQRQQLPWEDHFLQLIAYKEKNGHTNPTESRTSSDADYKLARWLREQRQLHRGGKLVMEKVQKLRELGCIGFSPDSKERFWETRFLELVAYKDRNGNANPQKSEKASGADYSLALWLIVQRSEHRGGKLAPDQRQKLKDLGCRGFDLVSRESCFQEVTTYKDRNGHVNPPQSKPSSNSELKLSKGLNCQRQYITSMEEQTQAIKKAREQMQQGSPPQPPT